MKDSFYFQHDYNSANDQRILQLRARFNNAEGYGIYFMILEAMAQEQSGRIDRGALAGLSLSYGLAIEKLTTIIDFCIETGLFVENKTGIFSKRMLKHKAFRKERSESGKKGAEIRKKIGGYNYDKNKIKKIISKTEKNNTTPTRSEYSLAIAQPMQRKGKERKGYIKKEMSKEKEDINKALKTLEKKYSSIKDLQEKDLQEIANDYKVPVSFVLSELDTMKNWLGAKGKKYKNYKLALRNWVKKGAIQRIDYARQANNKRGADLSHL